jgi:hypothetical protein
VKQRFESPFHDLECRAPQPMHTLASSCLAVALSPGTSDNRAFLVSLGHLDVVSLDGLELEHRVNALDRETAIAQRLLQLLDGLVGHFGLLGAGLDLR